MGNVSPPSGQFCSILKGKSFFIFHVYEPIFILHHIKFVLGSLQ